MRSSLDIFTDLSDLYWFVVNILWFNMQKLECLDEDDDTKFTNDNEVVCLSGERTSESIKVAQE